MRPTVSIVIPTAKRFRELQQTLLALETQSVQAERIVIIDDGNPPDDWSTIQAFCQQRRLSIHCLSNAPQRGPAAARNKGILASEEEYILFINDDTRPTRSIFLEQHLSFAARHPNCCILGKLDWAPETPNRLLFGPWTKRLAFDVGYDDLEPEEHLGFHKFCTANVLVPRRVLQYCLFDERFPFAAYEDIELGYRLAQRGSTLLYNPESCVYHVHRYDADMVVARQKNAGHSLAYLLHAHPELQDRYSPKLSRLLTRLLILWVNSPFFSYCSEDFRLFCRQLAAKYAAFWESDASYTQKAGQQNTM
ncbi:hypothetical protein CSB45_06280 [candidate division KSB3 bacterium]|uniref:Glycosyltransferase 2-like domain-containing protein n=1 Tax=candidate division KSB3 bacterium TaxID=2044937 RepID=A0A2G6E6Z9_9BACT|nr:MAG: hypothetical protein CSB45_06280 [candidate division KSB3 bacterium]PIE30250.1 MAG: hypothetical protein CSA57_04995 [candidate division KSB3 bacterium]